MIMSQTVEFIFFQLKASVKPEDTNNDEGSGLLNILQTTKQQSGYHSSAWGRTVEDENVVAWVIGKNQPEHTYVPRRGKKKKKSRS